MARQPLAKHLCFDWPVCTASRWTRQMGPPAARPWQPSSSLAPRRSAGLSFLRTQPDIGVINIGILGSRLSKAIIPSFPTLITPSLKPAFTTDVRI
ncbi:hypothetical protein GE21DRAFT_1194559, partial [Neurospora crassa]